MSVPERSPFLSVFDRFMSVYDRFMTFFCVYGTETEMKSLEKLIKRSGMVRNDYETVENAQERSGTVNVQELSGMVMNGQER